MHVDAVFVSGVPGSRVSIGDAGHKIGRYLALGDATETRFSSFLVRRRLGDATGDTLKLV
jgi:hypothetical protein